MKIEAREIYIGLGEASGASPNVPLRIKRPIALVHPVTHAKVSDWIPIGTASLTAVGKTMSRAVVGELADDVKVGDVIEAYRI